MGAIGEGVAEAPLERIERLAGAVRADAGVRRDLGVGGSTDALGDAELVSKLSGEVADLDLVDAAERRRLAMHLRDEIGDRLRRAADPHQHAVGVVEHFA